METLEDILHQTQKIMALVLAEGRERATMEEEEDMEEQEEEEIGLHWEDPKW